MINRGKTLKFLMATTAAIAIGTASPIMSQSAWVSVEGGMANISSGYAGYEYPVRDEGTYAYTQDGTGINMAFEVGVDFANSPYSVSVGVRHSSDGSGYYSPYSSYSYTDEASFTTLDFEVGRDLSLGDVADGRLTLGVRGAQVNRSGSNYGYSYAYGNNNGNVEFSGAGPRVALEAEIPVMDRMSLDVEAGAAILFGTTTSTNSGTYYSYSTYSYETGSSTHSESTMVTNLDFSAAMSYLIGEKAKVSLGYRYESFTGMDGYSYNSGPVDSVSDQGAFLKFTTQF